jgi:predicted ATPase
MKLDSIKIEGFRSIKSLDLNLLKLNVIIGANGSGKSNLLNFFDMMKTATEDKFSSFVTTEGGADRLLHFGQKQTDRIRVKIHFDLYRYTCTLKPKHGDSLFFETEHTYDISKPEPSDGKAVHTSSESILYTETGSEVTKKIADAISKWQVYHFHDTSKSALIKKTGYISENISLKPDGSNLAAYLLMLRDTRREYYDNIVGVIRMVAPFFHDFVLRPTPKNENSIKLEWRHTDSDALWGADSLSDGTLRFMCLTTLLMQPQLPDTILLDEPELGLHPYAIVLLAEMMNKAAHRAQIIVSTQSVTLVDQFQPHDLIVVDLVDGKSQFTKPSKSQVIEWLDDYSLGELWEKNIFGGRPR